MRVRTAPPLPPSPPPAGAEESRAARPRPHLSPELAKKLGDFLGGEGKEGGEDGRCLTGQLQSADPAADALGLEYATMSLLEPHKRYQNSVSFFQKRPDGWAEEVLTRYP